jgi:hypothetical protein
MLAKILLVVFCFFPFRPVAGDLEYFCGHLSVELALLDP